MKHIHIPTFIIFGVCILCISTEHFEFVCAFQYYWAGTFAILILTYFLSMVCMGKHIILPKDKIMKTVCLIGLLEALYSVVQLFGIVPDNFRYAYFSGSLNNPAIFGMFMSFCIPISVYYWVRASGTKQTIWEVIALTFGVFVVLSNSRTAILSSILGTAVILVMEQKSLQRFITNKQYRNIGIALILITLITLYFYKRNSADGRVLIWIVSLEMIKDNPWFGWGFDGYIAQYMNYQADYLNAHPNSPFMLLAGETQNPFNEFLHTAIIYGIPCAIVFIGIIIWAIWYIYARVTEHKSILLSIVCVLIAWCLFCYPLNMPFVWLIILFITLSMINRAVEFPAPKLCMAIILFASAISLRHLALSGIHDFRRLCLQERANNYNNKEVMAEYEEVYKDYYNDYLFIYNYGALLHHRGEFEKSLEVFKDGSKYLSDYNMMLLMADDYQKLKQYDFAVACYKRAGEMIPSRYLPLYYRMQLYLENEDIKKAHEIANQILSKENKIKKSKLTQQIINEAKECLNY